jgi:hypothetical protein
MKTGILSVWDAMIRVYRDGHKSRTHEKSAFWVFDLLARALHGICIL